MKVKIVSVFRDKFTGKYYSPGEVIEISEESRVRDMENRGLAERVEVGMTEEKKEVKISLFERKFEKKTLVDALKAIGEKVTMNMKEETLVANVIALNEESTVKLKESLGIEA